MNLQQFVHTPAVTCGADSSLAEVAREMDRHNVGSVLVVGPDGAVTGIVTDRDIALRAVAASRDPGTPVREIMTTHVNVLREDADLLDAAQHMAEWGCRRLPIVGADGSPRGVIAFDDLMIVLAQQADGLAHAVAAQTTTPLSA